MYTNGASPLRLYQVILNGKKIFVKAPSWHMAFKLVMVGHKIMPCRMIIKPVKKKKIDKQEQDLPIFLKRQIH